MTDVVYEIACVGERGRQDTVAAWIDAAVAPRWTKLPGLTAIDIYSIFSGAAHDPFVDDGLGPLRLAMLQFADLDTMQRAVASPAFAASLAGRPAEVSVTGTPFERRLYAVGSEAAPGPLTAPFSYVVRYHRPAEDEQAFVRNYLDTHPQLLGQFPRIRSVLCYLPLEPISDVLPAADYMIGNEVAFDSVEDFNAAMASPLRHEARQHYRNFPPFSGRNTHYPMLRRQLRQAP
jgi:uncharacterized protein (TIGR02118 family)